MSGDHFRAFLESKPSLMLAMIESLVGRVRTLTSNLKDMALLDVYGRVVRVLERVTGTDQRVTHQELANMVGASREMVSRIMRDLVQGDYVEHTGGCIAIKKKLPKSW